MMPCAASQTQPVPRPAALSSVVTTRYVDGRALSTISALVRPVLLLPLKTPNAARAPTAITSTIATMPMIVARFTARWSITRWIADWVRLGRWIGVGDGAWKPVTGCCGGAPGVSGCVGGACGAGGCCWGGGVACRGAPAATGTACPGEVAPRAPPPVGAE